MVAPKEKMLQNAAKNLARSALKNSSLRKKHVASVFMNGSAFESKKVHTQFKRSNNALLLQSSSVQRNFHTTTTSNKKVIPFKLADIGEGITKVEVVKWFIKEGDKIEQFQNVAEVMSDKANVEISSRFDGIVTKLCYKVGDIAAVGAPLIEIEVEDTVKSQEGTPVAETPATPTAASSEKKSSGDSESAVEQSFDKVLTTPAVRRIARENNIDITKVQSTGRNGRVLKEDMLNYLQDPTKYSASKKTAPVCAAVQESAPVTESATPSSTSSLVPGDRRETVRGLKRTMIKTMTAATKIPHFGYKDEIYMDNLMELRQHLKKTAEKQGIKLSYMPFIIKAISLALNEYPILNSSLTEDESEIIYKGEHNIGVAMDTPNGLLVPNIKRVQTKSIMEIAAELNRLQELGKAGKLGMDDLKGGTFTLSNIGTIGGTYADPVLSIPEVCIGAIGMIKKVATFDANNNIIPRNIMYVSWSADHRVIDGASMARFSNRWKEYLENPDNFIVNLR